MARLVERLVGGYYQDLTLLRVEAIFLKGAISMKEFSGI